MASHDNYFSGFITVGTLGFLMTVMQGDDVKRALLEPTNTLLSTR